MEYTFKDRTYTDLYQLGKDIYLFQEDFMKELRENKDLSAFIKATDLNKYQRMKKVLRFSFPEDIIAFRISLIFNPYIEFRYKKRRFDTYQQLGLFLLENAPEMDSYGQEIIHYNLLSLQMLFSSYAKSHNEEYQQVLEIEKEAENDISYSYFLLAFYLSKKTTIRYFGSEYKDVYSLLYYLRRNKEDEAEVGLSLAHSQYLKAYSRFSKEQKEIDAFLHINEELDRSENKLKNFLKQREEQLNRIAKDVKED